MTTEILALGRKPQDAMWRTLLLNDLSSMQTFVEGCVESIELPKGLDLWVNDCFLDLEEVNLIIHYNKDYIQTIKGNVLIASRDIEGNTVSLNAEQVAWIQDNSKTINLSPFGSISYIDLRKWYSDLYHCDLLNNKGGL